MKKRVLLIMGLCLMLLAGGCSKNSVSDAKSTTKKDTNPKATTAAADTSKLATVTAMPEREEYKSGDYVKLGKYKGIEISVVKTTVSDADVEKQILQELSAKVSYEKIDKKVVAKGDTVNIDFEGIMNGKAFDGGSATGFDLTIGSNQFIEGFESGLIGKKVGDKVSLDLKFPKDYGSTDLAGKAVTFNVTINYIEKEVKPELTDAFVKKNSEYKSVDEYKKAKLKTMEADNESSIKNEKYNNAYKVILDSTKISSVPDSLIKYYTGVMNFQVYYMAKQQGTDVTTYLTNNGMTVDSFNQNVASVVTNYANQDLIIDAIAEAEKISVTDKEIEDAAKDYMTQYGYTSIDDLYKIMPKQQIKQSLLSSKVMDFVIENAKINYTAPTPTPAATATPAASK